jgi:signal transduction histidine kinase
MFRRERAFSSEVAHELRTPLTGLLSTIEVCLRKPRESEKYQDVLRRCRAICQQSQTMVENLLDIAQLEQGNVSIEVESVNLSELLAECWESFEASASQKQLTVTWSGPAPTNLQSDAEKLRVIIRNLMQNAVSYSNESGEIRFANYVIGDFVRLAIENTGNEVTPNEVAGIYDRFWRGDGARSQTGRHFGLGLSLVQKLVNVLQATMEITVSGGQFRVELSLPQRIKDAPLAV